MGESALFKAVKYGHNDVLQLLANRQFHRRHVLKIQLK